MRVIAGFVMLVLVGFARAEIYMDIKPFDNLGAVKKRLPYANVEKISPGWATASEALYQFSGKGMSGVLVIKFDDSRLNFKEIAESQPTSPDAQKLYEAVAQQSDEEAMTVAWVRWVPEKLIPLDRLISKFGKPNKRAFSDSDYEPYRAWDRGIEAFLTDNEKFVTRIDFSFTRDEYRKAFNEKFPSLAKPKGKKSR